MIALNPQQLAAVTAPDGPVLVLAGAGSGKTRVIVERLAWLIEERAVDPRHLLAVTFTNKAASEMQARLAQRLNVEKVPLWVGTFHSFGLYILRREIERLGRSSSFTVFDDADQLSLMKRLIKELPGRYEPVLPRDALSWMSSLKQGANEPSPDVGAGSGAEEAYRVLWTQYHAALLRARALDFDDLLVLPVRIFEQHPDTREKYQRRFRYVLVDEYQDTNRAQYLLAHYLSSNHGNLFVVGDEDQSIYSWRGADINNILDFQHDYEGARVFRLEQNYRSTKQILDASNALVAHNTHRLGKTLKTELKGAPVRLYEAESGDDEARFVIEDLQKRALALEEVAVLYRTNSQSRLFETACRTHGINYIVVGGVKFYSRKEVKDILAYLRLLVNPEDDESMRRVLNVPPRGIGGVSLEQIESYAAARGVALLTVLREVEMDETLSARARKSGMEFVQLIDDLAVQARQGSKIAALTDELLTRIGYREYVKQNDEKDYRDRLDIVAEFITACKQYDVERGGPLAEYLQEMALLTDLDTAKPGAPALSLMSCHSVKGLEFGHVYLVGLEEGLLPFTSDFDPDRDLEEERRLCYVAMTRARHTLTLAWARTRILFGKQQLKREPSRFLREIGLDRLEFTGIRPAPSPSPRTPRSLPPVRATVTPGTPGAGTSEAAARSPAAAGMKMGTKVRHAKFGPGVVQYTIGTGEKMKVKVRFNTGRMVTLLVSQAPLEVLDK